MKFSIAAISTLASLGVTASTVQASSLPEFSVNVISSASDTAEGLRPAFEAFRAILGGENNGDNPPNPNGGHRQINWESGAKDLKAPGDFFATTRGMIFDADSDGDGSAGEFVVSDPPEDSGVVDFQFDSIVGEEVADDFIPFSPERIFSPLDDNVFFVRFVNSLDPSQSATVKGFGAVFLDVDEFGLTKMEFFDENDNLLKTLFVEEGPLSFAGADFGYEAKIAIVRITLGDTTLIEAASPDSDGDVVVMDDFIFGEPEFDGIDGEDDEFDEEVDGEEFDDEFEDEIDDDEFDDEFGEGEFDEGFDEEFDDEADDEEFLDALDVEFADELEADDDEFYDTLDVEFEDEFDDDYVNDQE